MKWPHFNDHGDLPPGIHRATLSEVLEHFGQATLRRQVVARRLERIYALAAATHHLARFIVYGSFVTSKPDPGDVDVFMLMDESFNVERVSPEQMPIFSHMLAHDYEGASVFWSTRAAVGGGEQELVEHWQLKRDGTHRGVVEVTEHD